MDNVTKTFGYIIAFVCPGFVGVWALSFVDARVTPWLERAAKSNTSVGDFLVLVAASIAAGVFLQGFAWLLFDKVILKTFKKAVPEKLAEELKPFRADPNVREVTETCVEHHYRYYQFYSNTLVAGAFALGAAALSGSVTNWPLTMLLWVVSTVVMGYCAVNSLRQHRTKIEQAYVGARAGYLKGRPPEGVPT